ncbi:kinesin-like protein KIN-14J isoform X1 [Cucurbita pepo subsp. pepo]|uniref:kinesin-like protein KIN-14J isoform X1 n=1 Tax=Cucurbita pepo subsp. pepo TaxID=3664 RepID=UPI000C9D5816|nr:kinesin-like protein KIN-14J isoform X1 [Cucurbita pepo subsp. pepo]XP_023549757.1 kinesin-like protein KIN-14J isoform X1 [Cucurbita pepo subsp. pepo]XP_023549758.1 kinesin-like protein KIN-14J isoform X1 [Cucurbita pepo subsp. pepo]XP_023549759.1 kinesin-like protein KIN-14J isoform X1 [Cucurbita pepo subsp. pepo]XP_023549760.1 kinesin-like protein KIN-14J isoform X1 [Cucurbita pepo subsp. pepo]
MAESKLKLELVEWLNCLLPHINLPFDASVEELRACLSDGTVLCSILEKLCPGAVQGGNSKPINPNIESFLITLDELGLPGFEPSVLEQGSIAPVLHCLSTLRASFDLSAGDEYIQNYSRKKWNLYEVESLDGINNFSGLRFQDFQNGSVISMASYGLNGHIQSEDHEGQEQNHDVSGSNIMELIKSRNLENVSTQSLFNTINGILDGIVESKNGDVSHQVAYILRKVVQVLEQRIVTHAGNLKHQSNLLKAREEKFQSKIKALQTLATGTTEENEIVMNRLQRMKIEKFEVEEMKNCEEQNKMALKEQKERCDVELSNLKEELEKAKREHENHCLQLETNAKEDKAKFEEKLNELEYLLADSRKKVEELETFSESKSLRWKKKEFVYHKFVVDLLGAFQELRISVESIKHEVLNTKSIYAEEFNYLGMKFKGLADVAQNYHAVLNENRRLYNEVQDLKGNIRVYCRIRPFLPGQNMKLSTVEYIGENGELVIINPAKQGKDNRRLFKFNKVFGPTCSQEDVFLDTQPLVRSVLDGYNVCIFAYGQTGSGKTYTMSGPDVSLKAEWGVNYRALNDLFEISQTRKGSISYEIGVQMVEIYNEQVRDLLSTGGLPKRLGIWNTTQPNGLAVPDACMNYVRSTSDVLDLMKIGLANRTVGATALNERSSRSHSVLTIHVRGVDLETDAILRGSLHLIDLAGSERVDRSEATGDRLKEAQHINKSLSALGDVIFALAQKNSHVPYRNSKLTQVLQSSLGGQAKTLMFVQINPDAESYSETISTLKFAERVSGVELGAARSNKEGRYVRELMDQVAVLKDTIASKDEDIERLQLLKTNSNGVKHGVSSLRYESFSPRKHSSATPRPSQKPSGRRGLGLISKATSDHDNYSDCDRRSECGSYQSMEDFRHHNRSGSGSTHLSVEDFRHHKRSGSGSTHLSVDDLRQQKEFSSQSRALGQNVTDDVELLGFGNADSDERLSDISDGGLSMGTETDGSLCSVVEYTLFPEVSKPSDGSFADTKHPESSSDVKNLAESATTGGKSLVPIPEKTNAPLKTGLRPPQRPVQAKPSRVSLTKSFSKAPSASNAKLFIDKMKSTKGDQRRIPKSSPSAVNNKRIITAKESGYSAPS